MNRSVRIKDRARHRHESDLKPERVTDPLEGPQLRVPPPLFKIQELRPGQPQPFGERSLGQPIRLPNLPNRLRQTQIPPHRPKGDLPMPGGGLLAGQGALFRHEAGSVPVAFQGAALYP